MIKKRGKIVFEVSREQIEVDTTLSEDGIWGIQHEDITVAERTRTDCINAFQAELEKKATKRLPHSKRRKTKIIKP